MKSSQHARSVGRSLRVGACQVPEFLGDVEAALGCIEDFAARADALGAQLLLFPECFLQGYLVNEEHLRRHALDLRSSTFTSMLRWLCSIRQTLVFGLIELRGRRYNNTAVVVAGGELVGAYRKTHLLPGEALFQPGEDYPTFERHGVRFGINICSDTRSVDAAAQVAYQGARLLLVPAQNMLRRDAAEHWKDLHHPIRAERARQTGMWIVSADVTGQRDEHRIGLGPTSVINPLGQVVAQVPVMSTGIVIADVC